MIRRRRRSGFVGRRSEQAQFQEALGQVPEEATQFLFHIHGPGGVGKSTLARQLESAARQAGALTAYVDEAVADPVEAMESISTQLAAQGAPSKELGKALAAYRQRRHEADSSLAEAEAAAGAPDAAAPSPSSMILAQVGLVGAGMVPGLGAFTGAVGAQQVAAGADRLKAVLSAHLRNHEDVQLVTSPLPVLTPVLLRHLTEAARDRPWVVLLFDTYERTGPRLDTWLRDLLVSDRYGELPANVMVLLAGQSRLDARCWGDWLDLVTDLPLDVFTEDEARHLLAAKGVTDERVVEVILTLSGGLPVLVSMLAETRPTDPAEVGDPSGTAVERFLKWETDPARRAAALACALPLELDQDICRTAIGDAESAAGELFTWLRSLAFVRDHAGRCVYHDVVRNAMLRLQRQQSPERWRERHTRLADAFRRQREESEGDAGPSAADWKDERWRAARLHETYHRLCADPRAALPDTLAELVSACRHGLTTLRRWADTVTRAAEDTDATTLTEVGHRLRTALDGPEPAIAALTFLLSRSALDSRSRALAHALRGQEHRTAEQFEQAMIDYDRAIELGLEGDRAYRGRAFVHREAHRYQEALDDFTRAAEAHPDSTSTLTQRAMTHVALKQYEEAIADCDRVAAIDPGDSWILRYRGGLHRRRGDLDAALDDLNRGLALAPDNAGGLRSRGALHHDAKRYEESLADLDRAVDIEPDNAFGLTCRGNTLRAMGRYEEALADFDRALDIDPDYNWARVNRGLLHASRGHHARACADYDEALDRDPDYTWALRNRAWSHHLLGRFDACVTDCTRLLESAPADASALVERAGASRLEGHHASALDDLNRALEAEPDKASALVARGLLHRLTGRYDEALADLTRAVALHPDNGWAHYERAVVLHARHDPARDEVLTRAVAILESGLTAPGDPSVPTLGNLVLAHCLMPHWEEADRRLTAFLAAQPPPGQLFELLAVMNTLVDVCPEADTHLVPLRRRLSAALADAAEG
ncbi:ATP-binding protein [Streptomyces catenulae]|uniref:Tetratricopeptide repeat protein n=1 Tax=Streptomyces catenulae TaxID=66875 RepID=A0ABV2YW13_9ACTN|nr:ATP-binding protein [Streptomyces catenulae]